MGGYLLRRLLQLAVVLFGITILLFAVLKLMPGDPARVMAGLGATPEVIESIRVKLGLDKPLATQYWRLIGGIFNGNLRAVTYNRSVWAVIFERLPATLELGVFALGLAVLISIPSGVLAGVYRNTLIDYGVTTLSIAGVSIPVFWFAMMLIRILAVKLHVLPVSGRGDTVAAWSFLTVDGLKHLVIPVIALAAQQMAMNARLMRASMLEIIRQEYIKTAQAKGLRKWIVIVRHAFPNAVAPVITNIGLQVGALFGGVVVTETVTAWPGIGRLMMQSILRRDQSVVFGLALFVAAVYMFSNLIVDMVYAYINPRVTYD
jgi:peptide/nickel transport system permease protein